MSNPFKTIHSAIRREDQVLVDVMNNQLKDLFGLDTVTGLPIFRIVWSEDETEVRHGTFTDFVPGTDIFLRTVTETRTVPKYRQWVQAKHILERLVVVPEVNRADLPNNKVSYEPLWVFEDKNGNYLPPRLDACKFIIDTVLDAQAVHTMMITGAEKVDRRLPRYTNPDGTQEQELANRAKRIDGIAEELFGDESSLGTETFTESGRTIIVPHRQFGEN